MRRLEELLGPGALESIFSCSLRIRVLHELREVNS